MWSRRDQGVIRSRLLSQRFLTSLYYLARFFIILLNYVVNKFSSRGIKVEPIVAFVQVCQFVVSVNGLNVLSQDYRTVSNLILTGPRTIVMEVMEEA